MHGLCVHEEYDLLFFLGATAICNPVVLNTSSMKDEESLFLLFGKLFSTKLLSTKLLSTKLLSAIGGVSSVVVVVIDVSESATQLLLPASGTGSLLKKLMSDIATWISEIIRVRVRVRVRVRARLEKTGQDKRRQEKTRQARTRQDKTRQARTRQDKTRHNTTGQGTTTQDNTQENKS
jgi:hypothetical protein